MARLSRIVVVNVPHYVTQLGNARHGPASQKAETSRLSPISDTGTKCWDESLGYDAWGNLLSIGRISGYTCSNEELLSVAISTKNQIVGSSYDAAGNLLNDGAHSYTYDAENRILTAAGVTYTYNADGLRIKKSNGTVYYYGMGSDPLDETDLAGSITTSAFKEYIFFNGKRIASRDSSNAVKYYFSDHLGTSRIVASSAGAILDDSDYYPFGGERTITSSSGNHYKFTSKERDSESGLDDFGARYFSSATGRFTSPDWSAVASSVPYADFSNPQSLNLYGYVKNNPLNSTDPDGHCCDLDDAVNFVVGLANAYGSDNLAGAGRQNQPSLAGKIGAAVGDSAATFTGGLEVVGGVTGEIGGSGLVLTGAGAPAGLAIDAGSALVIAHGGSTFLAATGNLLKSSVENSSSGKPYENTPENQDRMEQGKAPVGNDGKPVELHHEGQQATGETREMTQTEHRGGANFKKNHPNTGQQPSKIDRNQANQARRKHWKQKTNEPQQ